MRGVSFLVAILSITACDTSPAPTMPAPAPRATITHLSITGLPDPIIFDVPPAFAAGRIYQIGVRATLDDGTTADVKPDALLWTSSDPSVVTVIGRDLSAHGQGTATITLALPGSPVTTSRELTVSVTSAPSGPIRSDTARRTSRPVGMRETRQEQRYVDHMNGDEERR